MHVIPNSDWSKYSLTLIKFWTQCIQKIEHFYELLQQLSIKSYRAFLLHAQNMFEGGGGGADNYHVGGLLCFVST